MAIEEDVEDPKESELFGRYERIKNDHHVLEFLCDYLRMVVSGGISPFELDNLMTAELDTHEKKPTPRPTPSSRWPTPCPALGSSLRYSAL